MIKRVLIIGGYGNFGSQIAGALAADRDIQLIIGGRSIAKARNLAARISTATAVQAVSIDINQDFASVLSTLRPDLAIHTSGPFQAQDYRVATACIELGIHYVDMADGRDFVAGIGSLDESARRRAVAVISGASSVPCLSSAVIERYRDEFESLEELEYGITTAQKYRPGPATTAAVLGYLGKPFTTRIDGRDSVIHGWQGLERRRFRGLGNRWLGYCDIPDLALFPGRYGDLRTIRFRAGMEVGFIHLALWCLAGLVRLGLVRQPRRMAPGLHRLARLFDWAGTDSSGFYLRLTGKGRRLDRRSIDFELVARRGDGQFIPCVPAILLARRIVRGDTRLIGAAPCVAMISLDDYLEALRGRDIAWHMT